MIGINVQKLYLDAQEIRSPKYQGHLLQTKSVNLLNASYI